MKKHWFFMITVRLSTLRDNNTLAFFHIKLMIQYVTKRLVIVLNKILKAT